MNIPNTYAIIQMATILHAIKMNRPESVKICRSNARILGLRISKLKNHSCLMNIPAAINPHKPTTRTVAILGFIINSVIISSFHLS